MADEPSDGLAEAVRALEQRLGAVERELAAMRSAASALPPLARPAPQAAPVAPRTTPPPLPPAYATRPVPVIAQASARREPTAPAAARPGLSLEATIGKNWASWIGAVVLVLGVLFFLKYAWDQGWIQPTPTGRVMAAIVLGLALSATGEWLHRRRMKVLAGAMHGAGLAIVMAAFFGAYAMFPPEQRVLSVGGAFAGVIVTALAGIAVAVHINAMTPAIIALLGMYLAPFVLNTSEDRSAVLLAYLGAVSAIGWGLGFFKPRWLPVRWLAWLGTFISYFAWWQALGRHHLHDTLAIVWGATYYAGFGGEMFFGAQRAAEAPQLERSSGSPVSASAQEQHLAVLSLLNTAAIFGMLYMVLEQRPSTVIGSIAIGLAVVQGLIALASGSRAFMVSAILQAMGLATMAAPLMLDDFAITLAWLTMAVAVAALSRAMNLKGARIWGLVLLALAIARLIAMDAMDPRLRGSVVVLGWLELSHWMLMAWGTAMLAHLVAWLVIQVEPLPEFVARREAPTIGPPILNYATPTTPFVKITGRITGALVAAVGTLLFLGANLSRWTGNEWTLLAMLWLAPIIALAAYRPAPSYLPHGALLAILLSLKWWAADGVWPLVSYWESANQFASPPLINMVALNGLLLIAAIAALMIQCRRNTAEMTEQELRAPGPTTFMAREVQLRVWITWMALLAFALINFEAIRAVDWLAATGTAAIADKAIVKQVVLSVFWALTGFGMVVGGFRRRIASLRYAALILLGVTLVKIIIVDMAQVQAIWRILSFLAVGALLLGVSYLYHRQGETAPNTTN